MSRFAWLQPVFAMAMLYAAFFALGIGGWKSQDAAFNVVYSNLLPSLPFVLLAVLSFVWPQRLGLLCGAAIGAAIAVGLPWGLLRYDSAHYEGGGANIGLGLLILAMPIYLPLCMLGGYGIAALIRRMVRRARWSAG